MQLIAERNELRLGTMLVGGIQTLWSILPGTGADFRLIRVLNHYGYQEEWLVVMLTLGVILLISSITRWRAGRQIGLVLSCAMWVAFTWIWIGYLFEVKRWMIGTVLVTAPFLGLYCFVLFINDVLQKPANKGGRDA